MWADYLKEREGKETIAAPGKGFIVYKIVGDECFICDAYTVPHHRSSRVCWDLADKVSDIAKRAGCKLLTASICPSLPGASVSMQAQLSYGFKIVKASEDWIVLAKELYHGR